MVKLSEIRALIDAYIKTNGNQQITGHTMNVVLNEIVRILDERKQDVLVSGENIKTIGGMSLLGEGDIPGYDDTEIRNLINAVVTAVEGQNGEIAEVAESVQEQGKKLAELSAEVVKGKQSANLFNKETTTDGYYVTGNGLQENANYCVSDFIPIEAGKTYSATIVSNSRFYNKNKADLGPATSTPFTAPSNAAYVRFSLTLSKKDDFMFNEGSELLPYENYGTKLKPQSIGDETLNFIEDKIFETAIKGKQSANLFNKATTEDGYYVTPSGLAALANWSASDFIPIKPNTTYSATKISNARIYNENKKDLGSIIETPFTTPSNAAYVRLSVPTDEKDTFMLNEGDVLKEYEPYGLLLPTKYIDSKVVDYIGEKLGISQGIAYFDRLRVHLSNPFVKTQIKLVGDSITAGMGGTGFSATGEVINETTKANVLTATCWSNMLYHYIADTYNKDVKVSMSHPLVKKPLLSKSSKHTTEAVAYGDRQSIAIFTSLEESNTISNKEFCQFDCFGKYFYVCVEKDASHGVFDVIVDGVKVVSVDCSSSSKEYMQSIKISLSDGVHKVSFVTTGTSKKIRINGLIIPKTAIVKPFGVSGVTSEYFRSNIVNADDDFVIAQFGTNDRAIFFSANATYENLVAGCKNVIKNNAVPILMCATPTSEYHQTSFAQDGYFFTMNEVHDAIAAVSENFNMPFIDNYTAFQEYAENHGMTTDDLLHDGLHPNDLGYKVIFMNVMKALGLARQPFYNEWLGSIVE